MTETTPERLIPDPRVDTSSRREVMPGVTVIENHDVDLVPNIGVIGGEDAVLVVDTGLGVANGEAVLAAAEAIAGGRRLFLTTTHFHPEHAFGAQAFAGKATYIVNGAQADDLARKSDGYLALFRGLGETVARRLQGVHIVAPDVVYDAKEYRLDLGGRTVVLRPTGQGHTLGDQVVLVPDAGVLFTGDLAETDQFPIFPWFPPYDVDVSGDGWAAVLSTLQDLDPKVVVPGHGALSDAALLGTIREAISELRDAVAQAKQSDNDEAEVTQRVTETMIDRHPDWRGREWISTAVAHYLSVGTDVHA